METTQTKQPGCNIFLIGFMGAGKSTIAAELKRQLQLELIEMDQLIDYLNTIPNLYCVGRNGQHRYNNIDHSMVTSFEAVKNILSGRTDKSNIWNVNTEKEYHEEKKA